MPDPAQLSRRERQIMDLLIARGSATAAELRALLPDAPGDSATRTFLRILVEKGWVVRQADGRRFVYRPVQSPKRARTHALQEVVKRFFEGSLSKAVAALVEGEGGRLDPAEIQRVETIIRAARKSNPKSNP